MLPVQEAEAQILALVHPLDPETDQELLNLLHAPNRILSQAVTSALDFPHWDNSAMDGYAVRFTDVQSEAVDFPVTLQIVEEIPAGYQPQQTVQAGQAARIFTGAMLPKGADTIVIQEETQRQGDRVVILNPPPTLGNFVRQRGAFYQAGTPLLPAGIRLQAPEIAVLAAAQCAQVSVYRRVRVAIFSTGNELISPDQPLQPGQIVDSNQYALAALVQQIGAEPILLGIVPDQPEALKSAIAQALATADVVVSSGGVSVGDYDYVDGILADLGAEIHIRSVAVKPGKPLTVATFKDQALNPVGAAAGAPRPVLYFGLPGNPVSALVTFWRFVQPALRKLSGLAAGWSPEFVVARSQNPLRSDGKRETYLWGTLQIREGQYTFQTAGGSHSSGNLINLAQTNALAVIPVGQTQIPAGEGVQVLPLG